MNSYGWPENFFSPFEKISFLFEKAVSSDLGLGWRLWVRPCAVEWDPLGVHPILASPSMGP